METGDKFMFVNIREYLAQGDNEKVGESELLRMISDFSCPKNPDVEHFLKENLIEFTKKNQSVLIFCNAVMDISLLFDHVGEQQIDPRNRIFRVKICNLPGALQTVDKGISMDMHDISRRLDAVSMKQVLVERFIQIAVLGGIVLFQFRQCGVEQRESLFILSEKREQLSQRIVLSAIESWSASGPLADKQVLLIDQPDFFQIMERKRDTYLAI